MYLRLSHTPCVAEDSLKLTILPPLPAERWDNRPSFYAVLGTECRATHRLAESPVPVLFVTESCHVLQACLGLVTIPGPPPSSQCEPQHRPAPHLTFQGLQGIGHAVRKLCGVFLAAEVEAPHLAGIAPLVEDGSGLIVLDTSDDGTVDNHLQEQTGWRGLSGREQRDRGTEGACTCWSGCSLRPTTRKELAVGLW